MECLLASIYKMATTNFTLKKGLMKLIEEKNNVMQQHSTTKANAT